MIRYNGIMYAIIGINCVNNIVEFKNRFPRKFFLAKAYDINNPVRMLMTTVIQVITRLFVKHFNKSTLINASLKCAIVKDCGINDKLLLKISLSVRKAVETIQYKGKTKKSSRPIYMIYFNRRYPFFFFIPTISTSYKSADLFFSIPGIVFIANTTTSNTSIIITAKADESE